MRKFLPNFILKNINIIDVENGNINTKNVYVHNGKILQITNSLDLSLDFQEINCKNKFLLPGLIDSHCHISSCFIRDNIPLSSFNVVNNQIKKNLINTLKNGITTVRDMSSPIKTIMSFKEYIEENKLLGSRIFSSGPIISIKDGYPNDIPSDLYPFSFYFGKIKSDFVSNINENDIKNYIWELIENGIDFLNISYVSRSEDNNKIPVFSDETIKFIINFANNYNKAVSVNLLYYDDFIKIIDYKIDSLEHIVKDKVVDNNLWNKLKANNIYLVPRLKSYFLEKEKVNINEKYFEKEIIEYIKNSKEKNSNIDTDIIMTNIQNAIKSGVNIISASNAGAGLNLFDTLLDELILLNKIGLDNLKVIQSCTINSAKLLKAEGYIGDISEGKIADLIVLNSNPLEKIELLTDIKYIIKDGLFCAINT